MSAPELTATADGAAPPPPVGEAGRLDRLIPWLLLAAAALFCLPLVLNPGAYGGLSGDRQADSLRALFAIDHVYYSVRYFGELPLRTPFGGGGYPIYSSPIDLAFTPLVPLLLLCGGVATLKLFLLVGTWVTSLVAYFTARRMVGLGQGASLFCALVICFSGWLPSQTLSGLINIFIMLTTVALYLLLAPGASTRRAVLAGLLLGVLIMVGPHFVRSFFPVLLLTALLLTHHHATRDARSLLARLPVLPLAVLLLAAAPFSVPGLPRLNAAGLALLVLVTPLAWAPARRRYGPVVVRMLVALGVALAVASGRLYAIASLVMRARYERLEHTDEADALEAYMGKDEFYDSAALFLRAVVEHAPLEAAHAADGTPAYYEFAYLGLGFGPALCAAAGVLLLCRRLAPWIWLFALLSLLCFGPHLPGGLDLYALTIRGLPGFDVMSQPYKYFNFFIAFCMALFAGAAVDRAGALVWGRGRGARAALLLVAGGMLAATFIQNFPVYSHAMAAELPELEREEEYYQVMSAPDRGLTSRGHEGVQEWQEDEGNEYRDHARHASLYSAFNVRQGIGTIDWAVNLPLPEKAAPRYFVLPDGERVKNREYFGEAYFEKSNECEVMEVQIRANSIDVEVDVREPALLVINQNYDRHFTSDRGEVTAFEGRLAVRLEQEGDYTVKLLYRPWTFIWITAGAAVFFLTALIWGLWPRRRRAAG